MRHSSNNYLAVEAPIYYNPFEPQPHQIDYTEHLNPKNPAPHQQHMQWHRSKTITTVSFPKKFTPSIPYKEVADLSSISSLLIMRCLKEVVNLSSIS